MIELGIISVKNAETFTDARRKIFRLAEALAYDAIDATRLVAAFSELLRNDVRNAFDVDVAIGLEDRNGRSGLTLRFSYGENTAIASHGVPFFDIMDVGNGKGSATRVLAFKYLSNADFSPSEHFLETVRQNLSKAPRGGIAARDAGEK